MIREIAEIIAKVSEIGATISSAVEEQSAATSEIASNISGVTQASEETSSSSTTVLTNARSLNDDAGKLDERVSEFLQRVRAM